VSEAQRDPHVLISARIGANSKMLDLPSHRSRWGWIVMLGQAKLQHPPGRFETLRQARFVAGEFRDCLPVWLDAGLLHAAPTACDRCRQDFAALDSEEVVVHDWRRHQERVSRSTEWREKVGIGSGHENRGNTRGNSGETPLHHRRAYTGDAVPVLGSESPTTGEDPTERGAGGNRGPLAPLVERVMANLGALDPIEDDEARVFAFLARNGAAIRPDAPMGRRLLGIIERRGAEAVIQEAARMAKGERLSDRQFVFGLENRLEAPPSAKEARAEDVAEDSRKRTERTQRAVMERRLESYRFTGKWPPEWGPVPAGATDAA
jgi:hypothetical protein